MADVRNHPSADITGSSSLPAQPAFHSVFCLGRWACPLGSFPKALAQQESVISAVRETVRFPETKCCDTALLYFYISLLAPICFLLLCRFEKLPIPEGLKPFALQCTAFPAQRLCWCNLPLITHHSYCEPLEQRNTLLLCLRSVFQEENIAFSV